VAIITKDYIAEWNKKRRLAKPFKPEEWEDWYSQHPDVTRPNAELLKSLNIGRTEKGYESIIPPEKPIDKTLSPAAERARQENIKIYGEVGIDWDLYRQGARGVEALTEEGLLKQQGILKRQITLENQPWMIEGWKQRLEEVNARLGGGRRIPSAPGGQDWYVAGDKGWGISFDYQTLISPEGEQFTLAEMQTRLGEIGAGGYIYDFEFDMFRPATEEGLQQREQEVARLAGEGVPIPRRIEDLPRTIEGYNLAIEAERAKTEQIFQGVFPDTTGEEIRQLLEGMRKTPDMSDKEKAEADEVQLDFLQALRDMGRSTEAEALLRTVFPEADNEFIDGVFGSKPKLDLPLPEEAQDVGTPQTVLALEPEWEHITTGEVITESEKAKRYPKGYEPELDEWRLTAETGRNYTHVFKVFGEALTKLPKQLGASILQAMQPMGASAVDKDWADRWIESANTDLSEFAQDVTKEYSGVRLPISMTDLATLPQSMAFSLTSMGAGLAVGLPIALIPEPTPASRIAAWAAGTAASGAVAFNMSRYQIMQTYLDVKNEEMKATVGREITLAEEEQLKRNFSWQATKYGLWEAVPEALSNLAFAKLLTLPLGKMVGKSIAVKMLGKIGGLYGEEFLTETITQKGQSAIEVEAGLREGNITWIEAFKEIAPQTFLLTTILGGTGQISVSAVNRIKRSLKKEAGDSPAFAAINENITEDVFAEVEYEAAQKIEAGEEIPTEVTPPAPTPTTEPVVAPVAEVTTGITPNMPESYVTARKRPDGKWQLFFTGTRNEVFPNELFTSASEAKMSFKVAKAKLATPTAPEVTLGKFETVYRGEGGTSVKEGNYWSPSKEWSAQFTQTGRLEEVKQARIKTSDIYEAPELPYAGDPDAIDAAVKIAKSKGFKAVRLSEGGNEPNSILVFDRTALKSEQPIPTAPEVTVPTAKPLPVEVAPPTEVVAEEALPPPEGATRRVFDRIELEPAELGIKEKIRQGWHKFNVWMIDDLYAVNQFVKEFKRGGLELSIEENPYLLARLLKGVTSKSTAFLEKGTFGKRFWKIEKGKAVPNFTGESLETILQEVQEPTQWQDFTIYLVSRRVVELTARDIKTGIELVDAQASIVELEAKYKNFSNLAERVYKYQDNLMVYANEMGLISEDLLGKLRKYGNYVPFYRVFNELQAKGFMGKKMANIASPIKKIKGSEREIINPLESIVKNTYTIINAADRNQIGIAMANLVNQNPEISELFERVEIPMARVARVDAKELGVEVEGLSDEDADLVVDIFRPSFFVRGDEVTVLVDGKKQYFRIDPDLRDALLTLDRENIGLIGKILGAPTKWLRAGATLSPDFMVRNPLRDQMTAFVYSSYGFLPGIDFMRGVAGIISKDSDYQLFRMSGAEHSMMVSMDRQYLKKTFKEIVEGKKFTDYVKHPLELFQIVSELGEKATRLGEFKNGIRRGAVPLEAGMSARNVSLDFAQAGTSSRAVNRLIAFFNANIRGWDRMITSFKEQPVRTSMKVFIGITLPSILLYLANRDDPRWKEIPQWQKDLFWIVFTGDNIYRIPKPFELGIIFGSMPERFLEYLDNKDPEMLKDVLLSMAEAGSPGYIPTALLPIIENMANYSIFMGRSIVPASREKMPPELQYTKWTGEFSKKLGEILKLSPAKIDTLINGWTGGLGRYATDILSGILKKTGISPNIPEPSPELADIPVIKAFVVRNPYGSSGEAVESFYNTLEKYEEGEKYLQEMLKLGNQDKFNRYKASHPELLFFYEFSEDPEKEGIHYSASARYLRKVARDLSELTKKQDEIYKSTTISPDEKQRLIDEIDILKTSTTRLALSLLTGEPEILENNLNESIDKLGEPIDETPVLSLEKPNLFDMGNLYTDFNIKLEGVTKEDLDKLTDIDPLAYAYIEARDIRETTDPLPNKRVYQIIPDLQAGVTFEDYYKEWQRGKVENEDLDNLDRRQIELLRKFHSLSEVAQGQFLLDNPELYANPKQDWLWNNPKENAILAIFGKAKLLSTDAYQEAQRLIKEWDIPDSAISDLIKVPKATLELQTKYREQFNLLESYQDFLDDTVKDADGLTARARAVKELRQTKVDGDVEFRDIERQIDVINKGTNEAPIPDKTVNAFVEHMRIVDEHSAGSAEAKLNRYYNTRLNEFLMNEDYWGTQKNEPLSEDKAYLDNYLVPRWGIDKKYRKEDDEYDNGIPEQFKGIANLDERRAAEDEARDEYKLAHLEYTKARYRRDAYGMVSPDYKRFPIAQVETFVAYRTNTLLKQPDKWDDNLGWYEDDWWLMARPDFVQTMIDMGQWEEGSRMVSFDKVPPREVFAKWQHYHDRLTQGKPREDYLAENKDLEDWMLLVGKIKERVSEKRRQEKLSAIEKARIQIKTLEEKLKW